MTRLCFKIFLIFTITMLSMTSSARDDIADYSVAEAFSLEQTKTALSNKVRFYFGNQKHGKIVKNFGEAHTNKKTNAFNKTDTQACQWAFLSAILALEKRALKLGGNAVINIQSNYRDNLTSSDTSFKCGAGKLIAGVALTGKIVTIE